MSIKLRINLLLIILGVAGSWGFTIFNYYDTKNRIFDEAFKKAELISSFAIATRKYISETARPIALRISDPSKFYPELMGGFFVARSIGEIFSHSQPGYYFRQASLNPVNPVNQATTQEAEIIHFFAEHPEQHVKKDVIEQTDGAYIYTAFPVIAEESCLKCHGSKEVALPGRVMKYPGPGGYDFQVSSLIGTFITYVPIQKAMENLKSTALKTALLGVGSILLLVAILWFFVSRLITDPVIQLTLLANEISQGKEIHRTIACRRVDEIGDLYKSFERMRVSIINLVKAISLKRNQPAVKVGTKGGWGGGGSGGFPA